MRAPLALLVPAGVAAALAAACGADRAATAPPAPPAQLPPTSEAQPRGADDPVVATVDGRPVYGSCVEAQARHLGLDRRAALDQCVAFELLAAAAEARGLRADPDVAEAWRREMVRALIAADLGSITSLDQIPADVREPALARAGRYLDRPPLRSSHYVLAHVPRDAPAGGPADEAARAIAEAIHAALADDPGVLPSDLAAAAAPHQGGAVRVDVTTEPYLTPEGDGPGRVAVPEFRRALYAIPEVGRISPPVRAVFGWFVILWWDEVPAADLRPSFFQHVRLSYFKAWADRLAAQRGLAVWVDHDRLAALADAEPGGAAPGPGGGAAPGPAGGPDAP